ncbi:MAG TPA: glycosyltransferase family 2 protein [Gaiellaceae bacterium]|nr:glycosyltransferase family 2 protein [Gaiellaceae bacterium]
MAPRVSVIVVEYNSGHRLARCLDAVGTHDPSFEIVVVDNGEVPPELEQAAAGGRLTLVTPPANLGFAGGCNLGARVASGEVLVFLNPDTVVVPGALERLVEALDDPSVGIAMARLRLLDQPQLLQSAGTVVHVSGLGWSDQFGESAESLVDVADVATPCGAAMALRAETFAELGGFHDEFFLYQEDVQLGWRAHMQGRRVVIVPQADVYTTTTSSGIRTSATSWSATASPFS